MACLPQGWSFPIAVITMAPVGIQPCQSPLLALPAVPTTPRQSPKFYLYLNRPLVYNAFLVTTTPPPISPGSWETLFIIQGLSQCHFPCKLLWLSASCLPLAPPCLSHMGFLSFLNLEYPWWLHSVLYDSCLGICPNPLLDCKVFESRDQGSSSKIQLRLLLWHFPSCLHWKRPFLPVATPLSALRECWAISHLFPVSLSPLWNVLLARTLVCSSL